MIDTVGPHVSPLEVTIDSRLAMIQPELVTEETASLAVRFSLTLARTLHGYGLPTHRLESVMARIHQKLGIHGQYFAAPSSIIASFGHKEHSRTYIMAPMSDDLNLEKLDQVNSLAREVGQGKWTAQEGLDQLNNLVEAPDRYGSLLTLFCFVISSFGAARLFGGGWRELLVSGIVGLFVGGLLMTISRLEGLARMIPPLAAVGAMVLAQLALIPLGPYSVYISTVTGLIVLLPGLSLTVGVTELATGHPISGSARVANAMVTFLMIGFGLALGNQISKLLPAGIVPGEPQTLPDWTVWPALAAVPLAFVVLFKARPRDTLWVFFACLLAYHSAKWGNILLGPEMGTFLASFLVCGTANGFARITNRPASILTVPGVMLLVPGSVGYQSISSLLLRQTVSGVESGFTMILLAVALVSGILFANGLFPSKDTV